MYGYLIIQDIEIRYRRVIMSKNSKYQLIVSDIIEKIENGSYAEGSRLPSEEELRRTYECSRVTIRHALSELQYAGYILSRQGSGSFVSSKHKLQSPGRAISLDRYMTDNDIETRNRVLRFEMKDADKVIAQLLSIRPGDKVFYIERLRYADDKPIIFERKYMSADRHPYLSYRSLQGSIYQEAENNGIMIDRTECSTIPCFPEKEAADLLSLSYDRPVLKVTVHAFTTKNEPFFCGEEYYNPDHYQLNFINKR